MRINKEIEYTKSSGNVFSDLGFADSAERLAKAHLVYRINSILRERQLTQLKAAEILGINQPKVSALLNGQLAGFSMERLIDFLNKLDQDVQILVSQKPKWRKVPAFLKVALT